MENTVTSRPQTVFAVTVVALLLGAVTNFVMAILVGLFQKYSHISVVGFTFFFVFPVGAFLCGLIGGIGYRFGARILPYRPSSILLVFSLLISLLSYLCVFFVSYKLTLFRGEPLSTVVSFPDYVLLSLRNTRTYIQTFEIGRAGSAGYLFGLIDLAGYLLGGIAACAAAFPSEYCKKCHRVWNRYFLSAGYTVALSPLEKVFHDAEVEILAERYDQPVSIIAGAGSKARWTAYQLKYELLNCSNCEYSRYQLSLSRIKPPPEKLLRRKVSKDTQPVNR